MCGIGKVMVTVKCEKVAGPTDPPMTTKAPCLDVWSNCPDLAKGHCYQPRIAEKCKKSCGLCPGLTPAPSNTCYDVFGNCADLAKTNCKKHGPNCKKSCGLCDGMTPHKTNTCYSTYGNCADLCQWYGETECKLACGKC